MAASGTSSPTVRWPVSSKRPALPAGDCSAPARIVRLADAKTAEANRAKRAGPRVSGPGILAIGRRR